MAENILTKPVISNMTVVDKWEKDIIFKKLFKKAIGDYSPMSARYKFLNSVYILETISSNLTNYLNGGKPKLWTILSDMKFAILKISSDYILLNSTSNLLRTKRVEIIQILEDIKADCVDVNKIDKGNVEIYRNSIKGLISDIKNEYINESFMMIKRIYNNWQIRKTSDVKKINELVYLFISTRLSYGYSWNAVISAIYWYIDEPKADLIKKLLKLRTDVERSEYDVYIPITLNQISESQYYIDNFNRTHKNSKIVYGSNIDSQIHNRTIQNIKDINNEQIYFWTKAKALDEYSAITDVVNQVLPRKIGYFSVVSYDVFVDERSYCYAITEWKKNGTTRQYVTKYIIDDKRVNSVFRRDFILMGANKYTSMANIPKNIFNINFSNVRNFAIQKYNYDALKTNEQKSLAISTLLEIFTRFINGIHSYKDPHSIIAKIAMVDIEIESMINNAFAVRMHILEKRSKTFVKNELEYLKVYFSHDLDSERTDKWLDYSYQNIWMSQEEEEIVESSLNWFKNNAIQERNAFAHEGKTISFFARLSIETLDSMMSLAMIRILNKKLSTSESIHNHLLVFKNFTSSNETISAKNFDIFKKYI